MKISWILSDLVDLDPAVDLARLKEIGSFWGSWRTWRAYQIDNVVCHDLARAQELIQRALHSVCNFYIPNSMFVTLDRPTGVQIYEGDFAHEVDNKEEIVAMHLAAMNSDIVLLLGFDFSDKPVSEDRLQAHKQRNYTQLTKQVMLDNPNTQWVLIDHEMPLSKDYGQIPNLTSDSLENTLQLLL